MRKYAILLAAPMVLSSFTPANASEWTNWSVMNPNSYKVTMAEMTNRCQVAVALTGEGNKAECDEVAAMLMANQCQFVPVPDGVRYGWMNGLKASKPHVYTKMVKALGTPRKAYVCTAKSGRVYDWYVGEDGVSCGNLGAREFVRTFVANLPPAPPPARTLIGPPKITTTMSPSQEGSLAAPYLFGTPGVTYRAGNSSINVGSKSTSAAASTSTSNGNGGCTTSCLPPHAGH